MNNIKAQNTKAPEIIENTAQWHYDRNLIDGASNWTQSRKLLEEFIETIAAQMAGDSPETIATELHEWIDDLLARGRIKSVSEEEAPAALRDSIGDQAVVLINMAEREGYSFTDALETSYNEIKDRKGRMINGVFVKEDDLG